MINFSITWSSCGIMIWCFASSGICANYRRPQIVDPTYANLLIHSSLVTQFLNFRVEKNTFSVTQPRNSDSLNSSADSFPFFGSTRRRVHLRPSYFFFLRLPYNDCALLNANCAVLSKTAPLPCALLTAPTLRWARRKIVGQWSENSPILKIGSKLAVWAKFCCMKQNCNLLGNFEGMVTVEWISQ